MINYTANDKLQYICNNIKFNFTINIFLDISLLTDSILRIFHLVKTTKEFKIIAVSNTTS